MYVTLPEPTRNKITRVPSERPSTVSQRTGSAQEVDLDGPGFALSNLTLDHTIWTSIHHGSVHRTVQNGVNLWRQLCSLKGAPPDDDADDDDDDDDM